MHSKDDNYPSLRPVWLFIIAVLVIETLLRVLPEGYQTRTLVHRSEEVCNLAATDLQLMGDSATSAISASVVERGLGGKFTVSNYALPGTAPMFSYFMLRRQIDAGRAPKLIVLAPNPFTWGDPMLDRFLGRFASPKESAAFLRDNGDFSDWFYGTLCRTSYTLRYREELYKAVTAGELEFFRTSERPVSSVQNTSAMILATKTEPKIPTTSRIDPRNLPPLLTAPITIHKYNERYLDKLCALAETHKIRVVWITLPVPEVLTGKATLPERTAAYTQLMQRMTTAHKNLTILPNPQPTMPDTHYADGWHMNEYGAWQFSQQLARQLAVWLKENPL